MALSPQSKHALKNRVAALDKEIATGLLSVQQLTNNFKNVKRNLKSAEDRVNDLKFKKTKIINDISNG